LGYGAIAKAISAAGVPAPRGGAWARSTVKALLANPRYAGAVAYGRTESKGGAADSRRKRRVARPGGPLVERFDVTQQLVAPELFAEAQKVA
jgi:hypothetical protein